MDHPGWDPSHPARSDAGGDSYAGPDDDTQPLGQPPVPAVATRRRRRWRAATVRVVLSLVSMLVFSGSWYAWAQYQDLLSGIGLSTALGDSGVGSSPNGDTNILIMGLDSRLDEKGNPLPQDIYDALHAGDADNGGYNANVLMLLHVPAGGARATSISIPRDDYVDLPGSPDGMSKGKIKQAYGYEFDQKYQELRARGITDQEQLQRQSREAARQAEIRTVSRFLGGVPIDHFVEVTLVSFYEVARVVQPITVCLNEDTKDSYSGANFHKGTQRINASQAVAFVRQRRDYGNPDLNFTDLDRERRQQAFIASLAYQLKQAGTFADPAKLSAILDVAKQNIAVDDRLNLLAFAQQASSLTNGDITFVTLPIDHFGTNPAGEDVNYVNLPEIQRTVRQLIGPPAANSPTTRFGTAATTPTLAGVVDVVNASGQAGLAGSVERGLTVYGFTGGTTSSQLSTRHDTIVQYGSGAADAAAAVANLVGGDSGPQPSAAVPAGTVRVILGTGYSLPLALSDLVSPSVTVNAGNAASGGASSPPSGGGGPAPAPTDALNPLRGGSVPCVN